MYPKFKLKTNPCTTHATYCWEFVESYSYKHFRVSVQECYLIQMIIMKQNDYMYLTYLIPRYVQRIVDCGGRDVVEIDSILSS